MATNDTTKKATKKRLASLDALRGMDMFWILGGEKIFAALFVLTGWAGWQVAHAQTLHSQWHGFTFYDLIFPLFIFLLTTFINGINNYFESYLVNGSFK